MHLPQECTFSSKFSDTRHKNTFDVQHLSYHMHTCMANLHDAWIGVIKRDYAFNAIT